MNCSPASNLSKWHYRLPFAMLLSTVAVVDLLGTSIGFSSAVSAKPRPSTPVVTSRTANNRISPQPVEAVLAKIQSQPSNKSNSRQVKQSRQVKVDRFQGISHWIAPDRQTDVSPIDRLIK